MSDLSLPSPIPSAVFDLDGTLLTTDSTALWMLGLITKSWLRMAVAVVCAPIALPLLLIPSWRKVGATAFLRIAARDLNQVSLEETMDAFARRFHEQSLGLRWRAEGIRVLQQHLENGHRVVVVTAAPVLLATRLLFPWAPRIEIIGSELQKRENGWTCTYHCRGQEKCHALERAGFGRQLDYAYSDSLDDLPILQNARLPYVINPTARMQRRLVRLGHANIKGLRWS
jgi:phosphatidylglycerophosphatase C